LNTINPTAHSPQLYAEGMRGPQARLPDYLAPDGSRFWVISQTDLAGLGFCELPPENTSITAQHQTVTEIWQFVHGKGQVRQRKNGQERVVDVYEGSVIVIHPHTEFQFRTTGADPLRFFVLTSPPWPGAQEAMLLPNHGWKHSFLPSKL
jgi:mannose-6-phosphate isomerase-like protein (cupin superfamily)